MAIHFTLGFLVDNISFLQVINNNFAVIGTISGSLLTGLISYLVQKNNNKHKLRENQQVFFNKILEQDLQEKRKLIKPLLQTFESIISPDILGSHVDINDVFLKVLCNIIIIKNQVKDFSSNYTIYMNSELNETIWEVLNAVTAIRQIEENEYNPRLSEHCNAEDTALVARSEISTLLDYINELKTLLYKEIQLKSLDNI